MQETLTGSGKRWESSHQSTSGVAGSAALDSFRVPAHSPMPESFICTGSISHSIKFRIPADPGCCQGGDRWEWCFQLSPCWQQGPARQGRQQAQAAFIYFAVCLLIILWWFSTGMSVWWCSIMCWKCGASGQTPCSYLMVGSWEKDGHGVILEHFGLPRNLTDVRVWEQNPNVNFCAPCCRGGILSLLSTEISKAL